MKTQFLFNMNFCLNDKYFTMLGVQLYNNNNPVGMITVNKENSDSNDFLWTKFYSKDVMNNFSILNGESQLNNTVFLNESNFDQCWNNLNKWHKIQLYLMCSYLPTALKSAIRKGKLPFKEYPTRKTIFNDLINFQHKITNLIKQEQLYPVTF